MYGRKFASRAINKRLSVKTESRDGVLWEIDWQNRICNVKIQGSNELVTAHFPQNEARMMSYMRKGNAVRLVHRGGIRGYLEVTGHGMAIPTPVSGTSHPAQSDLPDAITEGCQIIPTEPASMSVTILDGYYRLNGVLYSLSGGAFGEIETAENSTVITNETYPPMVTDDPHQYITTSEDSTILTDEVFPPMFLGDPIDDYELDPAPSGNKFRYDCFYVGIDGIITYLKGSEASSNPIKPSLPSDTVLIGDYILLWTGVTEITGQNIGMLWEEPYASDVGISAIDEFAWNGGDDTPETNVTVTIYNQYGWAISGSYTLVLSMIMGSGQIYSAQTGWHSSEVSQEISGTNYTFIYQRNQVVAETSPYFMAVGYSSNGTKTHANFHRMILLTEGGTEIEGDETHRITVTHQTQTLTPAANVAVDWDDGHRAEIEMDQDITFSFFNAQDKDKLILLIEQDNTGGWTPTMPAGVKFGLEITDATIDETANKRSWLGFIYHNGSSSYDLVAKATGYPAS
jgi:hypothetical protein